jgi:NADH-quinone oxidoreductase subunit L
MSWIVTNIWLIPAVPLAFSLRDSILIQLTPRCRRWFCYHRSDYCARILDPGVSADVANSGLPRCSEPFTWFTFGDQALRLGWVLDPLAAAMLIMITLVGLCIFVFSVGYMAGDKNFTRFFAYLSFFSGAMLGVVIANSLLLLFISWELVGLASYLLIGFWIERPSAAAAAKKAFITTRIGDLGFFLGMLWLYQSSGTLLFYDQGPWLPRRSRPPWYRWQCHFHRPPDFLRRCRQIRTVPTPRLAARCDGRTDARSAR